MGKAGKLSSLLPATARLGRPLPDCPWLFGPIHDGRDGPDEEDPEAGADRAGKALDGGGRVDVDGTVAAQLREDCVLWDGPGPGPGPALEVELALWRRVLLLRRNTRLACFWLAAAAGALTDGAAAFAQPLEDVVAPSMPPRPGRDG